MSEKNVVFTIKGIFIKFVQFKIDFSVNGLKNHLATPNKNNIFMSNNPKLNYINIKKLILKQVVDKYC